MTKMLSTTLCGIIGACVLASVSNPALAALPTENGYRGIWYFNQPSKDEYKYKYSGGFATYPQQHIPIAIYSKVANKTFFCFGGTTARTGGDPQELLHMVSYYDHATGKVPRPRILLNKHTSDAHDNPTLALDDNGHIWVFSPSHGTSRPSYIHRSKRPWDVDEFEKILTSNFSYTQPWHLPGNGFVFLHTHYGTTNSLGEPATRGLHWMTSGNGMDWTAPKPLANIAMGDYQISWPHGQRLATAFDFHPRPLGLNARANIYYAETRDQGATWTTVTGAPLHLPLATTNNAALIYDSRAKDLLVYLKDLNFDADGRPVILFLTSKGYESGPKNDPRTWRTARWTGKTWEIRDLATSHNNYDHGSLYIEPDGAWRVIAPTEPGPQKYNPGGEMVIWLSRNQGQSWNRLKQLTHDSKLNHTYARRPLEAHAGFYALWADGNARQPSECRLYFTNQAGDHVWRLPVHMEGDFSTPDIAW
jgi:hypothetical protein